MARRKVDMSEAYDYLRKNKGSYVLCFDVQHLTSFNKIFYKAGDIAILEAVSRIDKVATDDMITMRIGGDEFVLITGLHDFEAVKALSEAVLSQNEEPIYCEDKALPLSLWCGITTIPESLRYNEFYTDLNTAIIDSKK